MKIFILFITLVLIASGVGYAHETYGFKHMTESTGPMVGSTYCKDVAMHINWIDENSDGIVDGCLLTVVSHDRFHVRSLPVYDNKQQPCNCGVL